MLAVAKLSGTKWLSPWVVFCAVACIGVGVGTGASSGSFNIGEVSGLDCYRGVTVSSSELFPL